MTGSEMLWGRTGRVTVSAEYAYGDVTRDIVVDGAPRGRTLSPRPEPDRFGGWGAINYDPYGYQDDLPSLDAAVMWVLRRAAPDVWRAERGPVCLVRWRPEAKPYPWHLFLPGGQMLANVYGHHAWAMTDGRTAAAELAREEPTR